MKKATSLFLTLALALTCASFALATDTDTSSANSTASVEFEDNGAIELIDPIANATALGTTFGNMNIEFGLKSIPTTNTTPYTAVQQGTYTEHGVVVGDNRGAADPDWTLTVQMPDLFTQTAYPEASFSATINLANGSVDASHAQKPTGASGTLAIETGEDAITVLRGQGLGNGNYYMTWAFGDISLKLANDFNKIRPGAYSATLVWEVGPTVTP